METPIKVLPFGARVRLSSVDTNGYCGRDHHPDVNDIGFLGVITENVVWRSNGCLMLQDTQENVTPGTELRQDDTYGEDDDSVMDEAMYTVIAPDGRKLECMWFELEVIGSVVSV